MDNNFSLLSICFKQSVIKQLTTNKADLCIHLLGDNERTQKGINGPKWKHEAGHITANSLTINSYFEQIQGHLLAQAASGVATSSTSGVLWNFFIQIPVISS